MKFSQDQKARFFGNIAKSIGLIGFVGVLGVLAYNIVTAE